MFTRSTSRPFIHRLPFVPNLCQKIFFNSMTTSFGLFSQQNHCALESLDKPKKIRKKDEELVILILCDLASEKGQTVSNWGGGPMKFNRLYDGEVHVEESNRRRRQKMEAKKKQIAEKAFRPGNPSKKQASSGDYYGTFCVKPYVSMGDGKWENSTKPVRRRRKKMMVCRRSQYTLRRQRRDTMVHRALSLEKIKLRICHKVVMTMPWPK